MIDFDFRRAVSCSKFHVQFVFSLLSLRSGSRGDAIFGVYCCKKLIELRNERNWPVVVGFGISFMASILPGSALTPVLPTIWPKNLISCFTNPHFFLFNVSPYSAIRSSTAKCLLSCSSHVLPWTATSSCNLATPSKSCSSKFISESIASDAPLIQNCSLLNLRRRPKTANVVIWRVLSVHSICQQPFLMTSFEQYLL